MKENNDIRRRLEALITVFELAEHHEVVLPKPIVMLLDTTGKLMLNHVHRTKEWTDAQLSIELMMMERKIAAAAGEPASPLDGLIDVIMQAMAGGAKVEVVDLGKVQSRGGEGLGDDPLSKIMQMMDDIAQRTRKASEGHQAGQDGKADGGATPGEGNGTTADPMPSSIKPSVSD